MSHAHTYHLPRGYRGPATFLGCCASVCIHAQLRFLRGPRGLRRRRRTRAARCPRGASPGCSEEGASLSRTPGSILPRLPRGGYLPGEGVSVGDSPHPAPRCRPRSCEAPSRPAAARRGGSREGAGAGGNPEGEPGAVPSPHAAKRCKAKRGKAAQGERSGGREAGSTATPRSAAPHRTAPHRRGAPHLLPVPRLTWSCRNSSSSSRHSPRHRSSCTLMARRGAVRCGAVRDQDTNRDLPGKGNPIVFGLAPVSAGSKRPRRGKRERRRATETVGILFSGGLRPFFSKKLRRGRLVPHPGPRSGDDRRCEREKGPQRCLPSPLPAGRRSSAPARNATRGRGLNFAAYF